MQTGVHFDPQTPSSFSWNSSDTAAFWKDSELIVPEYFTERYIPSPLPQLPPGKLQQWLVPVSCELIFKKSFPVERWVVHSLFHKKQQFADAILDLPGVGGRDILILCIFKC